MARIARVVLPGYPHHIVQRGNRRQDVFFQESDYSYYLRLLKEWCDKEQIEIWAYCLMPNHIHLIVMPDGTSSLARAIGETHRRYTCHINTRNNWRGYLWQGRFASYPMHKNWLLKAAAYVEMNPVKAGIVDNPEEYPWSSVHAHLAGHDRNGIVEVKKLLELTGGDWAYYLKQSQAGKNDIFEKHERSGRPMGDEGFIERAEKILQRDLKKRKPGRKAASPRQD